ncbi:hypothetical protein BLNAU_14892 [Blattamonas nauphoetae]|uniref:Uncharacterized protein n=1 Tax=Blattamonas nauphoetae TaxID=2049346 RepID=A0ABQ9XE25_9EUKA|nr:hypothetical protein BLNAU_14892 [Blattamonas nauphoetae]
MIDPEYSPFMSWNPKDPITVDSIAHVFVSLVSMVRDNYQFDEELVRRASTFIASLNTHFFEEPFADDLLMAIGHGSPDPAAGMLTTPRLRDLSAVEDKRIVKDILEITVNSSHPRTLSQFEKQCYVQY